DPERTFAHFPDARRRCQVQLSDRTLSASATVPREANTAAFPPPTRTLGAPVAARFFGASVAGGPGGAGGPDTLTASLAADQGLAPAIVRARTWNDQDAPGCTVSSTKLSSGEMASTVLATCPSRS